MRSPDENSNKRWPMGFLLRVALGSSLLLMLLGCGHSSAALLNETPKSQALLELMSVSWGLNLRFEQEFLQSFGERNAVRTQFVANSRLEVYKHLFVAHSAKPDLLEIDIVWPSILADDLVDLRPYLKEDVRAFPRQLLENYTVHGRLVALPVYVDVGVLYYRPELLAKYGFQKPPETWEQLGVMASRIQAGERHAGNRNFWGYAWQGSASEGGTCNFLEWQSAAGAGNFIEPSGEVHVRSARFAQALQRGADWIGTISPPAEYVYREDDAVNLWDAGQVAFMRNWASGFSHFAQQPGNDHQHFAVAPLPAGLAGHRGTLGGLGMAVSKYAANRELAIKALLEMTSEKSDLARMAMAGGLPSRTASFNRSDLKARYSLLDTPAQLIDFSVTRPSVVTGDKYEQVSREYFLAVNSVLRRTATAEAAMAELEGKLVKITGLPARRD